MKRSLVILAIACVSGVGIARVIEWSRPSATAPVIDSTAHFMLNEMGGALVADIERTVGPALLRTERLAADPQVIAALQAGQRETLTGLINDSLHAATEIDVITVFDDNARLQAITTMYSDGQPVPRERITAVTGRQFDERGIITSCLTAEARQSALEFQTRCDITPAYFDSSGLSVAYSVPVFHNDERIGLISSRMQFERLTELIANRTVGGRANTVFLVGDDGRYFDERINRDPSLAPLPAAQLNGLIAPLRTRATPTERVFSYVDAVDAYITIFPVASFPTIFNGGLHLMLVAPHDWLLGEYRAAARLRTAVSSAALLGLILAAFSGWHWYRSRQLNTVLAAARQQADAANEAKSAFLANVSHELRTPMTAILGYTDLMQEAQRTGCAPEIEDSIAVIRRNGHHLLALINDVLDLSKIEAECLTPERRPIAHGELLQDVVEALAPAAAARRIALEVHVTEGVPKRVLSDPLRLRQILLNLVSNAVKFTPAGQVTITVRCDASAELLTYAVQDSGIGLTPEQVKRIFDPFAQADASTTRRFGGAGLGLCISRRLARLLGGEIEVESVPGCGSTFSATIATGPLDEGALLPARRWRVSTSPVIAAPDDVPTDPSTADLPLQGVHVVVVEDGLDNQRLLQHVLTRAGARVTLCNDGHEVVDWFAAHANSSELPQVTLMDMLMPGLDGYEATRQLRSAGHTLPIIALTANAMRGDREGCLAAGCDEYLSKPIDRARLVELCAQFAHPALH